MSEHCGAVDPLKGVAEDSGTYFDPNLGRVIENSTANAATEIAGLSNAMVDSLGCSIRPLMDSYIPSIWDDHFMNGHSLGYRDVNVQLDASPCRGINPVRTGGADWMLGEGAFLVNLPCCSWPHFPADSALVERAARLSCSSSDVAASFSCFGPMHGVLNVFGDNASTMLPGMQSQGGDGALGNQSGEAELDRGGVKKSKIAEQETSHNESKEGWQASEETNKEEYVHVRARKGQATNSHSLAERIRREKISKRMKLLQDLVPGCSKVTGKAPMLDEIINYVQSLQRQVEFLSMKLAAGNPCELIREGLPAAVNCSGMRHGPVICQATGVWEDELHSIVHGGIKSTISSQMKTEN